MIYYIECIALTIRNMVSGLTILRVLAVLPLIWLLVKLVIFAVTITGA